MVEADGSIKINEVLNHELGQKAALFIAAYTGIEQSQLEIMTESQKQKVLTGLVKQLEIVMSLHPPKLVLDAEIRLQKEVLPKDELKASLVEYFGSETKNIDQLAGDINSLLLYGEKREIIGTNAEHLHNELCHFWRILGWEELSGLTQHTKHIPRSIDDVEVNCGNLIRTLTLLKEYWDEEQIGPELIIPTGYIKTKQEVAAGYSVVKQLNFPTATVVVTGRNRGRPEHEARDGYKEKAQLLERLLSKFPSEFAFLIFEYYAFAKGWSTQNYNVAVVQEYISKEGKRMMKGLVSGRFAFLHSGNNETMIVGSSDSHVPVGSDKTRIVSFNTEIAETDSFFIIHGELAHFLAQFSDVCGVLKGKKQEVHSKLVELSKALGVAHEGKPIVSIPIGCATQQQVVDINEDMRWQATGEIITWSRKQHLEAISIEAGHIHSDRKPTRLQKEGIAIGALLARQLKNIGVNVILQPMIDEDHVVNSLDYKSYLNLMHMLGYNPNEVIFESSPVIREIAIAAIVNLMQIFPGNFSYNGNALIFNIPESDLQVEFVKDVTQVPFELGCVIFDAGLSLYRACPELGHIYSQTDGGKIIHQEMLNIYTQHSSPNERLTQAQLQFPYLTTKWEEVKEHCSLPRLPDKNIAVCNVLEGFYTPQQMKLIGVLTALDVNLHIVGVSITDQGLVVKIN